MARQDAEALDNVIEGTFSICGIPAKLLIDSGSSHSFISPAFASKIGRKSETMDYVLAENIPLNKVDHTDQIFRACPIIMGDRKLSINLILLNMSDFNVIIGMDWLSPHKAKINCYKKSVTLLPSNGSMIKFAEEVLNQKTKLI